jgi:hypothetical protein
MAQALSPAPGMSDPDAMPWSCSDVPEFPDAARALDLDALSERNEARLVPGQHFHKTWSETLRTPALQLVGPPEQSKLVAKTDQASLPTSNPAKHGTKALPAASPSSASDGVANNLGRQPDPSPSKKQRTGLTKADWKTMDYQDTESEE